MGKTEKVVFVGDFHSPYEDPACLMAFLSFTKWWKPNEIFIIGDLIDAYAFARFVKNPETALKAQDEIDDSISVLKQIKNANPQAKICLVRGNHCYRLQKYLWTKAPELAGLRDLTIESLLQLKNLGISYCSQGRLEHRGIVIKHGSVVRKFSSYTAKAEFEKEGQSGVSGHTHRFGLFRKDNVNKPHIWMECGCMCKKDMEYMEGEPADWHQGFGIGHFYKNGLFTFNQVPIFNGRALYDGREF
jgi:UDP-2,3-diacylglucosamine pyrophosphatase LpxH